MYEVSNEARNVPISVVAQAMGKDPQFVRVALQQGILPIGYALKLKNSSRYTYYVSPKKLFEYCGFKYIPPKGA